MSLVRRMFETQVGPGMFWVRLPLAVSMIQHGYGKVANLPGFISTSDQIGIAPAFAVLAAIAEFFGGIGILIGCLSRIAAFGVFCTMLVAAIMRHGIPGYGWLMNWHGALPLGAEGYEFHTLAMGMSLGIMFLGAGKFSIDHWIARRMESAPVAVRQAERELEPVAVRQGV